MAGAPRSGTGFVNFDSFVNANQGAINRTRSAMLDPVNRRLQNADKDRAYGLEDLNRNISANTVGYDPQRSWSDVERLKDASYGGPNSALDNENFSIGYGNALGANKDAQRQANQYGRAGALRDQFGAGQPTYSAGNQMFDSALLGAGGGRKAYEDTAKAGAHLFDAFQKDMGTVNSSINNARNTTKDTASRYGAEWNAPPALGQDNVTKPLPVTAPQAPASLGDMYTQRNDPNYLNAGRPGTPKKKPQPAGAP